MWLFNADTGAALNPNPKQVDALTAIAVSPDGTVVFTGNQDGTLQRWDAHNGELLAAQPVFETGVRSPGALVGNGHR